MWSLFALTAVLISGTTVSSAETIRGKEISGEKSSRVLGTSYTEREVCVVGGGPAGVYAARLLEKRGYDVALFDQAASLGGKTNPPEDETDIVDNEPYSMFRHVLTSDMTTVKHLIDELGLEDFEEVRLNQNFFIGATSTIFPRPAPDSATLDALGVYVNLWNNLESLILQPNHNDIPKALMVPAVEWFAENGLVNLMPAFYSALSNYGYSFFQEIPTIYLLKYFTPQRLYDGSVTWFPFHIILEKLGSELSDVNLNTHVKKLKESTDEDDSTWELSAKKNGSNTKISYKCGKVVLAFPPSMKALSIVKGLHSSTKNLFYNIRIVSYWEVVISGLPDCSTVQVPCLEGQDTLYFRAPTQDDLESPTYEVPSAYYRCGNGNAIMLFNAGDQDFDTEEVLDIVRGHLHAAFGYEPTNYELTPYKKWPYFPHVGSEAMQNGFYADLESVQGGQGLYFTGGFRDFELVDLAMKTTEDLLDDTRFPDKANENV